MMPNVLSESSCAMMADIDTLADTNDRLAVSIRLASHDTDQVQNDEKRYTTRV